VRVFDVGMTERTETQVGHGTVEEDLGGGVRMLDGFLQVGHEHQISRLEPVVVQGVMVNVAKNGSCAVMSLVLSLAYTYLHIFSIMSTLV